MRHSGKWTWRVIGIWDWSVAAAAGIRALLPAEIFEAFAGVAETDVPADDLRVDVHGLGGIAVLLDCPAYQ